jgi:hypothetical protein
MRPRDLFGVAVRVIGVWWLTQGCYWGYWAYWKHATDLVNGGIPPAADFGACIGYLIAGMILLVFADHIVRIVYGPQIRTTLPDADAASIPSTDGTQDSKPPP